MISKHDLLDLVADTGKALASGKRLEILELLAQAERGVGDLAHLAHLNVSTVSAHLQILKESGLVRARKDGTHVFYELAGDDVATLLVALLNVAERHRPHVRHARDKYLPHEVQPITEPELAELVGLGPVVILDVRPVEEFASGHYPGAINIPGDELEHRMAELPRNADVVVYCRGRYCSLSYNAVQLLTSDGRRTRVLPAGVAEWRARRAHLTTA